VCKYLFLVFQIFAISIFPLRIYSSKTMKVKDSSVSWEKINPNEYQQNLVTLEKLTFKSDVFFSKEEFFYLSNLRVKSCIDGQDLKNAYENLLYKKRFSNIEVYRSVSSHGVSLHFELTGNWILRKVTLQGIWFGKDQYTDLYLQKLGSEFDIFQHDEHLKSIRQLLLEQGYFNCKVSDELIYEKEAKFVTVIMDINKGKCFLLKKIEFELLNKEFDDSFVLEKILKDKFSISLVNTHYSKEKVEAQARNIKKFLKKKGFINCKIWLSQEIVKNKNIINIIFKIKTGTRKKLRFEGNTIFSNHQLECEIVDLEQPDWIYSSDIITEQILNEYYKQGYWDCKVKLKKSKSKELVFSIQEGIPVIVDHVEITNTAGTPIKEFPTSWNTIIDAKKFNSDALERGIKDLKNFFLSKGFWDFEIKKKTFAAIDGHKKYKIKIVIDLGVQRICKGCRINQFSNLESNKVFTRDYEFNNNVEIPFDINWISEQKEFLVEHFKRIGYWEAIILPKFHTSNNLKTEARNNSGIKQIHVFVEWQVNKGNLLKFGKIFLSGNTRMPFKRIIREINISEGDLWNRETLNLARNKLNKLDVFKQVRIHTEQFLKPTEPKPIIVTLLDDDPLEIRTRLGYFLTSKNFMFKRQSTPKFGASIAIINPTNNADKLIINGDLTRFEKKLNTEYQHPSIFQFPVIGKIKGYVNKYVHPVQIGLSESAYEAVQNGCLLNISKEYRNNRYWGTSVGSEWMKTSRVRGNLKLAKNMIDKMVSYFFLEPSIIIDKLDNKINTKKGSFNFVSCKIMLPCRAKGFTARLMTEHSLFLPICNDLIAAARIRLGHIFHKNFNQIMPVERFYLGGPYTVRGYEKDALPPLGITEKIIKNKIVREYTIQGGSSMINGNLEIRFPVYNNFWGTLFQDVGILSQSGPFSLKEKCYPSSGFGIRYKTPIGAIRFDIGWKWKHNIKECSPYAWYLTLGETF
jgi:outer membrane protein assembly factor BamA